MSFAQMPQAIESLQLDEHVWQSWLTKNRNAERLGFEKRVKLALVVLPVVVALLIYWLFKTP